MKREASGGESQSEMAISARTHQQNEHQHYQQQHQQQQQQQEGFTNFYNGKTQLHWQDKKLQGLRTFAYEYVKQIVAKADELSREHRYESTGGGGGGGGGVKASRGNGVKAAATNQTIKAAERVVQVAAEQINERFQLIEHNQQQERLFSHQSQCQSQSLNQTNQHQTQIRNEKPSSPLKVPPKRPPPVLLGSPRRASKQVDEISCDNLDYLEGAEENRSRIDAQNEWSTAPGRAGTGAGAGAGAGRKRSGIHNRLNWQIFISCFSTCLPQTLVDSIPSSLAKGRPGTGASGTGGGGTAV